ncbi:MAG: hypothetical protein ACK56F_04540, partial [bacterium]
PRSEIAGKQFANLTNLLSARGGKGHLGGQGLKKLLLFEAHLPVAMDDLAGQREGLLLLAIIQLRGGGCDQPLPRLLTKALKQSRDQHAKGIGLHLLIGGSLQQLIADDACFILAKFFVAAHCGQGNRRVGLDGGKRKGHDNGCGTWEKAGAR